MVPSADRTAQRCRPGPGGARETAAATRSFDDMSIQSVSIPQVPAAAADSTVRKARAGMAMSIATFVMAAASGLQAVLYLSRFGTNARTDGFFVAFAVYTTFGVFSQTLRLTSVPLLVEPRAKLSVRQFAAALGLLAVPVLIATIPLAGPVSHLIAPGLKSVGRHETAAALPVLGAAMILQLWAAGGATVLAVRDRFGPIATAYIAGAIVGLVVFVAVMGRAGVQTLGWSMLAMAVVTCATMLVGVTGSGGLGRATRALRLRSLARSTGLVMGGTPVYLALNMLFVVTLAFASRGAAGDSTVLSYAYLFASYLVAGTGTALGMSRIPEMTRKARFEGTALVEETVPQGYRYAMLLVAPSMALLITAGAPLIHALLPNSLTSANVHTLRVFTALLAPWTVVALLANFLIPAMLAGSRSALLNKLALPLLAVHLAATATGSALFGVYGAVGAMTIAPACLVVVLLVAGAGARSSVVAQKLANLTGAFAGLAILAFGLSWAISEPLASAGLAAVCAAGIGGLAYLAGLRVVARREVEVVLGAIAARRSAA
jgi:peptidoglycan biosynthesis protein MviN/MurJ (putative lipid II flippase)